MPRINEIENYLLIKHIITTIKQRMHISYILQLGGAFSLNNSKTYSDIVMALESLRYGIGAEFCLSWNIEEVALATI